MFEIRLTPVSAGPGSFTLYDEMDIVQANMIFDIEGSELTIYLTEIEPCARAYAFELFENVMIYVRRNYLRIKTLCPVVTEYLSNRSEDHADIWTTTNLK